MNSIDPIVSVNLCCYNGETFVRQALESIVGQTYKDWEIVIINDGSMDGTESIIEEFVRRGYPISYHYQKNHGLAYSRNKAVSLSRGNYIAFIDQDDTWMPQKLEKQMRLVGNNPAAALVFTDCLMIYPDGRMVPASKFFKFRRGDVFQELLRNNFIVLSTAMLRKDAVLECGGFPAYKIAEEYALFLKIAQKFAVDFVDEPLAKYLYHESNASREVEVSLRELKEIYQYWSECGDDKIKEICDASLGSFQYRLGRKALFHLQDSALARTLVLGSQGRKIPIRSYAFLVFTYFPMWMILAVRRFVLSVFYR